LGDLASIVKAYDIRGIVPDQLDEGVAEAVGAAFARVTGADTIVTMHDMRTSSGPLADAFGRGAGGFFGHVAGFHGTTHDVLMSRFWVGSLNRGTHKYVRRAKTWAATGGCGTVVAILPFVGWTGQRLRIDFPVNFMVNNL